MQPTVDINELKKVIKQSVKESVKESIEIEMMKLRSELLEYISNDEQTEIEKTYQKPEKDVADSVEVDLWNGKLISANQL